MNAIFNTNKRLESDENTFNNVQLAEIADQIDSLIDVIFHLMRGSGDGHTLTMYLLFKLEGQKFVC